MNEEMRVKELLGLAARGVALPADPGVDDILQQADRVRRRRRIAVAVASAAAMVAVGVGTARLPASGSAAPHDSAATAPWTDPAPPETGDPGPTAGLTGSDPSQYADGAPSVGSTSTAPTSGPNVSRGTSSGTPKPSGTPSTSKTGTATKPSAPPPAKTALDTVKALLPTGIGEITKKVEEPDGPAAHPLTGRYLVTKNGKMGFVDIYVKDPKVNPDAATMTLAEMRAYDHCDNSEGPRATDCRISDLPAGGLFKSWTQAGTRDTPNTTTKRGPSFSVLVAYADGRSIQMRSDAGFDNVPGYLPGMAQPPLTAEQLAQTASDLRWFKN
ncbi:hypothetical protein [Yinghuangia soli]|uniref:Uncharacterized protein n=1 Tax=Yinghuangia soli TaxID=2908204 RepID=A0AA41Q262_9ACTN|nr:hypothetical protein [Yinghuangia soli]MCF2529931.1 hypothetical protein [Yinghuangia soli]